MSSPSEPSLGRRILSGEAGLWASPIRAGLSIGEALYSTAIHFRNKRYDAPNRVLSVPVPVISVGNITVGGTGKTPMVIELARRLESRGRNPAVVARGYGAASGEPNDEELMVRKHCPGVSYLADPDRHRGADLAVRQMGADVIVLDDAFQHRRLKRDFDIVLIDAACPFGYGHVLPRGLLREPLTGLKRAHLIVITRSDQVAQTELNRIESTVRHHNCDAPLIRAHNRVACIESLDGLPTNAESREQRVVAFAAIGRPQGFVMTLSMLGLEVVASRWWPDHYSYRGSEVERFLGSRLPAHDLVLTTEKDAVKLIRLNRFDPRSIGVVRLALEFEGDGSLVLDREIDRVLAGTAKQSQ